MSTAISQVRQVLKDLPADASFEDIQYHIYVQQQIARGLADADAGRLIGHDQVARRSQKWLRPLNGRK